MQVIRISAALLVDGAGRVLLVRKRGTRKFMQAGGKIEANESALEAVIRELSEEVGLLLGHSDLEYLGNFSALAANEDDHRVDADVFFATVYVPVAAAAEIEEMVWATPAEALELPLAPLTREILLPLLSTRASGRLPA
ncbi:MAG: pyrophosphohydrolase [Glaciihabitans sp.]|nr:pyrophosphohydrolase [Glaciihabitans sp.]